VDHKRTEFVERVDRAVKTSPHLIRRDLRVQVDTDRVILTGMVDSYFQKQMAQEAVRRVDGVASIDNRLEVAWSEEDRERPLTVPQ
jgi:osmotically-inducible protein OsmY